MMLRHIMMGHLPVQRLSLDSFETDDRYLLVELIEQRIASIVFKQMPPAMGRARDLRLNFHNPTGQIISVITTSAIHGADGHINAMELCTLRPGCFLRGNLTLTMNRAMLPGQGHSSYAVNMVIKPTGPNPYRGQASMADDWNHDVSFNTNGDYEPKFIIRDALNMALERVINLSQTEFTMIGSGMFRTVIVGEDAVMGEILRWALMHNGTGVPVVANCQCIASSGEAKQVGFVSLQVTIFAPECPNVAAIGAVVAKAVGVVQRIVENLQLSFSQIH
jgi:hypothetical protein